MGAKIIWEKPLLEKSLPSERKNNELKQAKSRDLPRTRVSAKRRVATASANLAT